jgi:hypothetical protein
VVVPPPERDQQAVALVRAWRELVRRRRDGCAVRHGVPRQRDLRLDRRCAPLCRKQPRDPRHHRRRSQVHEQVRPVAHDDGLADRQAVLAPERDGSGDLAFRRRDHVAEPTR